MPKLPRGIAPDLLVSQVRNTLPYLFGDTGSEWQGFPPAIWIREFEGAELSHFEYFRLCLSAHYLSCATPVPTDVDNQIRLKLWPAQLPLADALEMSKLVLESRHWDFRRVSTRYTLGAPPVEKELVTGHIGEWFTVVTAAYCALKRWNAPEAVARRSEIFEAIREEVLRHSEVFGSLWRAGDGLECLKSSASIAHNFGDLDRVMGMWELEVGDPLRLEFHELAIRPFDQNRKLRHLGRLWVAGELYKTEIAGSSMALENHRHFALRKPKCLRQSRDYLIPHGPFFDEWGRKVGRGLSGADLDEVVQALADGASRLPKTVGYQRALVSIVELRPELAAGLGTLVPKAAQAEFEIHWSRAAIQAMDEIPSRAS